MSLILCTVQQLISFLQRYWVHCTDWISNVILIIFMVPNRFRAPSNGLKKYRALWLQNQCLHSRGGGWGGTSTSWWRNPISETVSVSFVPEVAKQHDVFAGAIAFGVLVSARASFWLDKKVRKLFECFHKDLPKPTAVMFILHFLTNRSFFLVVFYCYQVMPESINSVGNVVMRRFKHYINETLHRWLKDQPHEEETEWTQRILWCDTKLTSSMEYF